MREVDDQLETSAAIDLTIIPCSGTSVYYFYLWVFLGSVQRITLP